MVLGLPYSSDIQPSHAYFSAGEHAVARYAALCKEGLAPIGEPELLMATRSHYDAREWTTDKDRPSWTC